MEDINERSQLGYRMLHLSKDAGVSDFYITPWEPLTYRRNGKLFFDSFIYQPERPLEFTAGCVDYALVLGSRRYRVNRMVTRGRPRWVMRLLPESIPEISKLMVPPAAIKAFLEAKNGLFLVCGATGSGKSTTIASMILERAKRRQEHVLTFEDPIEFVYPSDIPSLVSQREIGTDELDFNKSLRAALRQAPDVILVGEIRDGETAEIALQAAETGHVVVATLHTSSAAQTVQRFLKLVPSDRLETAQASLADTLRAILCQRLLFDNIRQRRFATPEETVQMMSVAASRQAIERAGIAPEQIDCVIVATVTHLLQTPAIATAIAYELGADQPAAFDISAACAGFCHGLALADQMVRGGGARHVLVIGVERLSDLTDMADRGTAFIFADGAGAAIVGPSDTPGIGPVVWGSDGEQFDLIRQKEDWRDIIAMDRPVLPYLTMQGNPVFRWAVYTMAKVA